MKKTMLKSVSSDIRNEYRLQVKSLKNQGKTYPEISELLGMSLTTVKRYGRSKECSEKQRGRRKHEQQKLSLDQQEQIKKWITDKTPDQYKLPFALWTRKSVVLLVKEKFNIEVAVTTMGVYLRSWGMSPQKALLKAYEQNPEKVKQWLENEYVEIKEDAKRDNAEIYWADETGIRNDDQRCRGYSPIGQTPVLTLNRKRFKVNMISAVNNQGKSLFMIYEETMKVGLLIKFLVKLQKAAGRKIVVILDNLKVHHAIILQNWLKKPVIVKRIVVKYLPAYSPELNPDEYLNCDLKGEINRREPARNQIEIVERVTDSMNEIASNPQRIAQYFKHPKILYAA